MEPDAILSALTELRDFTEFSITGLSRRMDDRFTAVEERLSGVEGRLSGVEGRLSGVEGRLDRMERKFDRLETRVEDLETSVKIGFHEVRDRLTALERPKPRRS
jgi:predicted nuclease with TOPRIM domain